MAPGEDVDPGDPTVYANQAAWRRFLTILAGPAMNYLTAGLVGAALLLGPGLRTPDPGAAVGRLVPGFPAEQAGLADGDRVLSVADVPVSTWDQLVGQLQAHPGQPIRLQVERGQGAAAEHLTLELTPRDEGGVGGPASSSTRCGSGARARWPRWPTPSGGPTPSPGAR